MSARIKFGNELKEHVQNKLDIAHIGSWCHSVYVEQASDQDAEFLELLLHLGSMELGYEFAFTYEELEQIAEDLISGKDITI